MYDLKVPATITEVFQYLNLRIEGYTRRIFLTEYFNPERVDFDFIEYCIPYFPIKEAIDNINIRIYLISKLIEKKEHILDSACFHEVYHEENWHPDMELTLLTEDKIEPLKKKAFSIISEELDFYIQKLEKLKASIIAFHKVNSIDPTSKAHEIIITDNFKFSELKGILGEVKLDISQTALLFHYLTAHNIIYKEYAENAKALSTIVACLTGHSETNLRTVKGFGALKNIKENKDNESLKVKSQGKSYNLETVRTALMNIIRNIDEDISANK